MLRVLFARKNRSGGDFCKSALTGLRVNLIFVAIPAGNILRLLNKPAPFLRPFYGGHSGCQIHIYYFIYKFKGAKISA